MTRPIILALLVCPSLATAADWPQWLGPRRDNVTTEQIAPWTTAPKTAWTVKCGPGFSTPVVANRRVFVHARVRGKDIEEVIALHATSGKELWRTAYPRAPYSSVLNTGPQATPTVTGNRVYTFGITGVLSCLDTADGKLVWQVDCGKTLGMRVPRFGVTCSPLVVGSRVVVAVGGQGRAVVGFDAETGEVRWKALDESAGTASPVLMAGKPGRLPDVVFMTTLRLVGLNPLDGTVSWEFPLSFQPGGTAPTPLVAGDTVITTTTSNGTTAVRLKPDEEGKQAWQAAGVRGYFSSGVVAAPEAVYLVSNQLEPVPRADLVCVDLKSGKEKWRQDGLGYFHFGLIRTGTGRLLMLDDQGTLRLAEVTPAGYKELCKAKVCEGTMVTPALADGKLYVRDDRGVSCVPLN